MVTALCIGQGAHADTTPSSATDSSVASVQFPIAELGNCQDKTSCKAYCDDPAHADACLAFATAHHLMSEQEVNIAKKFLTGQIQGPGGCTSKSSCEHYCSDMSHLNECLAFAQKNNITPPGSQDQLEKAKKIQAAIQAGLKPPCTSEDSCQTFCQQSTDNMKSCIEFGQKSGILQGEELAHAQGLEKALSRGITPPPCTQDTCSEYCSQPDHVQACTSFAVAAGFITKEQADIAQKTGGKGPGGCVGQDACQTFCDNPDNQQACIQFAKDNGFMNSEDIQQIEDGQNKLKDAVSHAPDSAVFCLQQQVGQDMVEKIKSGFLPPKDIGEKMRSCFQQGPPPGQDMRHPENNTGSVAPQNNTFQGPGGCKTPEECASFCKDHPDVCANAMPRQGDHQEQGDTSRNPQPPCSNPNGCPPQNHEGFQPIMPGQQAPHEEDGQLPPPTQGTMMPPTGPTAPSQPTSPAPTPVPTPGTSSPPPQPTSFIFQAEQMSASALQAFVKFITFIH